MKAAVFSFSLRGAELSKRISEYLYNIGYEVYNQTISKYAEPSKLKPMLPDHNAACAKAFDCCKAIIFVGATAIAVRTIAPLIRSKLTDPAVLSVDERGNFVIPLLSGHIGGANELARCVAANLGAVACITTATDVNKLFAVDEWAVRNNMVLCSLKAAKDFAAALVDNQTVGLYLDKDFVISGPLPKHVKQDLTLPIGMAITLDKEIMPFAITVRLLPRILHLGIGCRRNISLDAIENLVFQNFTKLHLDRRCICSISTVDLKKDEKALLAFATKYKIPIKFYTAQALNQVLGEFTSSNFVKNIVGVDNVCERSAVLDSCSGRLLLRKTALNGVTLAIAAEKLVLDFTKTDLNLSIND